MNDMTTTTLTDEWAFPVDTYDLWATPNTSTGTDIEVPQNMARALVRTDTNQILGVHGSKYKAIKHDDVVCSILDAINQSSISQYHEMKIDVLENGAKMRGTINFPDLTIEPAVGDFISFQVIFYNSYDGSWSFAQQAQGNRLWCLNGCTDALTVAKTVAKHTTNVSVTASSAKIEQGLQCFLDSKERYQRWMGIKVDDATVENFFKKTICNVPNNTSQEKWNFKQLDNLMGLWNKEKRTLGSNKWALYNACTYWATHTDESRSPANTRRLRENQLSKHLKMLDFA